MRITARAWYDLKAELDGARVVACSAGPDDRVYVLVCLGEKDDSWINRRAPCDWIVLTIGPDSCLVARIPNQLRNYNLVQPITEGLLLATSRCEASQPNGHIFGFDGTKQNEVILGDGIQHLQTTLSGEIWAAYFDEGVFGNLGWKVPIGASGLLRFNRAGDRVFEFQPVGGPEDISDCYALNIVSDNETWCCYYTDFPLVRIVNDRIAESWRCPIQGAHVFAVWRDQVLIEGGYGRHQEWVLMTLLRDGGVRIEGEVVLEDGLPESTPRPISVTSRGRDLWYLRDGVVFNVDMKDLSF